MRAGQAWWHVVAAAGRTFCECLARATKADDVQLEAKTDLLPICKGVAVLEV